jgi:ribonucleoside-diphosphate reductase alpha chain
MVEQLQKDKNSDMQSFSRALARVLKGYIPDGTKSSMDKKCDSCGAEGLVYKEGCVSCVHCGNSRCG